MADDRYGMPVAGIQAENLAAPLRRSVDAVAREFPAKTGIIVFVFDFGAGGGIAYAANAVRGDCIKALKEWIEHAEKLS